MNASSSRHPILLLLLSGLVTLSAGVQAARGQASPESSPTEATAVASPPRVASPAATPTAAQPEEATTEKPAANSRTAPTGNWIYMLAVALIVLLGFLFYLLLMWASRHEQSSYLGSLFRDSVEEFEYKRFAQPHIEKWLNFGYHAHARQNLEVKKAIAARNEKERKEREEARQREEARLAAVRQEATRQGTEGTRGPGSMISGTGSDVTYLPPPYEFSSSLPRSAGPPGTGSGFEPEVEEAAKKNYDSDLAEARKKATQRAERATNVDLNVLRGRGSEFVLDFTAVVTLVFAVTILGLLNILDAQSISTLLAAIAGYVLGRASNRKQPEGRTGITTAEVTELIQAVTGAGKPARPAAKKKEDNEEAEADTPAPGNAGAKEENP